MVNCIHFRLRTKNKKKYCFCNLNNCVVEYKQCNYCKSKEMIDRRIKPVSKNRICVLPNVYEEVLKRDKNCCQLCGVSGNRKKIDLHHIRGRSAILTNKIDNCIMLCRNCHETVHGNMKKYIPILEQKVAYNKFRGE